MTLPVTPGAKEPLRGIHRRKRRRHDSEAHKRTLVGVITHGHEGFGALTEGIVGCLAQLIGRLRFDCLRAEAVQYGEDSTTLR